MLTEKEIQKALHASRVVDIPIANPHGPLGLEHVAQVVARLQSTGSSFDKNAMHPLEVPLETWLKLEQLAQATTKSAARPVSASELATAILQNYVATNP